MEDGRLVVVVLDFHATCFMPLPFIEVALKKPRDRFCQLVVGKITYLHRRSDDATALLSASGPLVQYGSRAVGKHDFSICSHPRTDFHRCSALPSGVSRRMNGR
jgi:hypothetical protein